MRSFLKTALFLAVLCLPTFVLAEEPDPAMMTGKDWIDQLEIKAELVPVAPAPQPATAGYFQATMFLDGRNTPVPIVDAGVTHSFSKYGLGVAAYVYLTNAWGEAYIGPTYKPVDWFQVGLYFGAEYFGADWHLRERYGTSVWFGYQMFSFTGFVDFNNDMFKGDPSDIWYDLLLKVNPKEWVGVGWRDRRFVGLGPYLEFNAPVPELPLTFWASWTPFDPEGIGGYWHVGRALVGAAANF